MKTNNLSYIKIQGRINNQEKNVVIYYNILEKINDDYFIDIIKSNVGYNDFFIEIDKDKENTFFINNYKKYPNLRLHWNDVLSNKFIIKSVIYEIYNHIIFYVNIIKNSINENKLSIINGCNYNISLFNNFINNIYQIKLNIDIFDNIINDKYNNNDNNLYTFNFINKLKKRYDNKNIYINNYFIIINQYIIIIKKYIDYIIKKTKKYVDFFENKLNDKIYIYPFYDNFPQLIFKLINKLTKIYNILNIINDILNDIYTVRRLLDKNYISNCIIYSKSNILYNYIFSLVKLFKFKITEISPAIININDLNQKINNIEFNIKYQYNIKKLFT